MEWKTFLKHGTPVPGLLLGSGGSCGRGKRVFEFLRSADQQLMFREPEFSAPAIPPIVGVVIRRTRL